MATAALPPDVQTADFYVLVYAGGAGADARTRNLAETLPADTLNDAHALCETVVQQSGRRCEIYRVDYPLPLATYTGKLEHDHEGSVGHAYALFALCVLLILAAPVLIWWDYRSGWERAVPTFFAINFVVAALRIAHYAWAMVRRARQA